MPNWRLLADLSPGELQTALLAEAGAVMDGKSGPQQDRLLLTLPQPVRAIWLLSWLDFEVTQGSLLAYFYNSHGRHARLAVEVLRDIGASRMADVVAKAAASYEQASAAWAARRAELDSLGEFAVVKPYAGLPNAHDLAQLTDQYWQAADDDDWGSRLDTYLHEQVTLLTNNETSHPAHEPRTACDPGRMAESNGRQDAGVDRNCTIRIVPAEDGRRAEVRQAVLDAFAPLGVDGEGIERFGLVALNVPSTADIRAVKRLVIQGADEGRWHYEEGCVTPEWRAIE